MSGNIKALVECDGYNGWFVSCRRSFSLYFGERIFFELNTELSGKCLTSLTWFSTNQEPGRETASIRLIMQSLKYLLKTPHTKPVNL